jgi:cellulose 1,4-beta-cellobiosidase
MTESSRLVSRFPALPLSSIAWLAAVLSAAMPACSSEMTAPAARGSQAPTDLQPEDTSVASLADDSGRSQHTRPTNPFAGARFHVDPAFADHVRGTAGTYPTLAPAMAKVASQPTAVWVDSIAAVGKVGSTLDAAAAESSGGAGPVLSVFVLYDLPNRDCAARSSHGELSAEQGGVARYRNEFIDPIAAAMAAHSSQHAVVLLEPDSLANLATNAGLSRCAAADGPYRESIAYAIAKLALPNVDIYLDAAHAGWLGWAANRTKIVAVYRDVLARAGGASKVRGFVTNVSNYNVLQGNDGKRLEPSTPTPDELTYVAKLRETLATEGIVGEGFVVDTGRNGRSGIRTKWGHWCNVTGAGLGERPRAAPMPGVDAYFWVKPPGDSDGASDPNDPNFDPECGSRDAANGAPVAGQWFPAYFAELVRNATPPL